MPKTNPTPDARKMRQLLKAYGIPWNIPLPTSFQIPPPVILSNPFKIPIIEADVSRPPPIFLYALITIDIPPIDKSSYGNRPSFVDTTIPWRTITIDLHPRDPSYKVIRLKSMIEDIRSYFKRLDAIEALSPLHNDDDDDNWIFF